MNGTTGRLDRPQTPASMTTRAIVGDVLDVDALHRIREPQWAIWNADPQGRLQHCADPGALKRARRPGAIVSTQRHRDFHEETHRLRVPASRLPVQHPAHLLQRDHKATSASCGSAARVAVGLEPSCIKACPTGALVFGTKRTCSSMPPSGLKTLKSRGFDHAGLYDHPAVGGHARMYVLHHDRANRSFTPASRLIRTSARGSDSGRVPAIRSRSPHGLHRLAGFFHFVRIGRYESMSPTMRLRGTLSTPRRSATPRNAPARKPPTSAHER